MDSIRGRERINKRIDKKDVSMRPPKKNPKKKSLIYFVQYMVCGIWYVVYGMDKGGEFGECL